MRLDVRLLLTIRGLAANLLMFKENIQRPSCENFLPIEEMLDAAVFFGPGVIVFDCPHCRSRVYFAPYENHIEIGTLGCSPVVDPIPHNKFSYPAGFKMTSDIRDGILNIQIQGRRWAIPRYGLWNERTDIPCPSPAAK
jgi:hypothetical protein